MTRSSALFLEDTAADRQARHRSASEKRVPSDRFASLDALEKKTLLARSAHPAKERHGCQGVGGKDSRDRHDPSCRRKGQKFGAFLLAAAHGLRLRVSSSLTARGGRPRAVMAAAR